MWGTDRQPYYKQGRNIKQIYRSQIEGQCLSCGYLTLSPNSSFEEFNGGLTVKRTNIEIIDDKAGNIIKKLKPRRNKNGYNDFLSYYTCNACINNWR